MKFIDRFLPNFAISMVLGLIVLVVLDMFNPALEFLTSTPSKVYYAVLALAVICTEVRHLVITRNN